MTGARAFARLAERKLAQSPMVHLYGWSSAIRWATPLPVVATNARTLSSSSAVPASRMGRGPRFAVSRTHRRPARAATTSHASDHFAQPTPTSPTAAPQPNSSQPNNPATAMSSEQGSEPVGSVATMPTDPSVHIPAVVPHEPSDVLQASRSDFSGATRLLSQSALVVTREVELMNIFLGFEQANKYSIHAPSGELVGYLAEEEHGLLGGALQRQVLRTHRPFRATVMDTSGKPVLLIRRPFTWINSTAHIYAVRSDYPVGHGVPQDSDIELIGEVQQRWHLYKRRYELFLRRKGQDEQSADQFVQFAQIDAGFLSWTFLMQDAESKLVGAIDRNFRGFGREIFTDTGQYVLRFDSVGQTAMTDARISASGSQGKSTGMAEGLELVESHGTRALTLDERAVALATAVSIDFDYFSRHSEGMHGGGGMFPWFYMGGMGGGGGEAAETPRGGAPNNDNVPANPNGKNEEGGWGTGVDGGAIGSGTSYPYDASESGMSDDGRLGQPRSNPNEYGEDVQQPLDGESPWWSADQQEQPSDVWGAGDSDPWAGAQNTQSQDEGFWGGWGSNDGGGDGGGGWGGFFGNDN